MKIVDIILAVMILLTLLPLAGMKPLTQMMAAGSTPKVVQKTYKFKKVNLILNYFWTFILALSWLMWYLFQGSLAQWIAPAVLILAAVPASILLVKVLPQYIREKYPYTSCKELFELMPTGICKRYARAIQAHARIQFVLTGSEPMEGCLEIDGEHCRFTPGQASDPTLRLECDSEYWLKIANGELDGIEESLKGSFKTEGDVSIMLHLDRLFLTGWKIELPLRSSVSPDLYSEYDHLKPVRIRKAVVFYSGDRSAKVSKTHFVATHVMKGLQEGGCEVEWVDLAKIELNPCIGCFTCWTKTPGKCIHRDTMADLIQKYMDADLAIFASPLYIFSVNGVMKNFMDRLIPMLKPYMAKNEEGKTMHPKRYAEVTPTHILVISAAGFPEIDGNFDGLRALYKSWASHMEGATHRGELLLPAAEMISIPEFSQRKESVAQNSHAIGLQLAKDGCASSALMREISNTRLREKEFAHMANLFWGQLDGKRAYLGYMANKPLQ